MPVQHLKVRITTQPVLTINEDCHIEITMVITFADIPVMGGKH